MDIPVVVTCLPVGGVPLNEPLFVPWKEKRSTTLSPSAIRSSALTWLSMKETFLVGDMRTLAYVVKGVAAEI